MNSYSHCDVHFFGDGDSMQALPLLLP